MKTYTISDGKLTSLDTYFNDGKWRLLQTASNSGIYFWGAEADSAAQFGIFRQNAEIPYAQFPSFALETTPFSIQNSTARRVRVGYFITEEEGHPYIQLAMATNLVGQRVVKKYDLITGQETSMSNNFSRVTCLYCNLEIDTYGIYRIASFSSGGNQMTLYLVSVRSGSEGAYLYDYRLMTEMSGTATDDYYHVPADIVYTIGNDVQAESQAIEIATRAETTANSAKTTADAAMNAINMANLDDKISV